MGHTRLGKLPRTRSWRELITVIMTGGSVEDIAAATSRAADKALKAVQADLGFKETVHLLCQLAMAGSSDHFLQQMETLGIKLTPDPSIAEVALALSRALQSRFSASRWSSDFSDLSQSALIAAVAEHIQEKLPTLIPPSGEDVLAILKGVGKPASFSALSRKFYSGLTFNFLDYFLSKTIDAQVGENLRFATVTQVEVFRDFLKKHCTEASQIVLQFSHDWFAKRNFHEGGNITPHTAGNFGWGALTKIRAELAMGAETNAG